VSKLNTVKKLLFCTKQTKEMVDLITRLKELVKNLLQSMKSRSRNIHLLAH